MFRMSDIENVPFLVFTEPIRDGLKWSARLSEAVSNWVDHFFVRTFFLEF